MKTALLLMTFATLLPAGVVDAAAAPDPNAPEMIGGVPFHPNCRRLTEPAGMTAEAEKQFKLMFRELARRGDQGGSSGATRVSGYAPMASGGAEMVQGVLTEVEAPEEEGPVRRLVIRRAWDDRFEAGSLRESSNGLAMRQEFWHFEVSLSARRLVQVRRTILSSVPGVAARMYCMAPGSAYAQARWLDVVKKLRDASIPRVEL